jgi:hypothetical protein
MGSNSSPEPGAYVGQLADHARKLQDEARSAIAQGDYARASALIGDAELLAEDVHGLVDDIEDRETDRLLELAANDAASSAKARRRRIRFALPLRRVGVVLGAGLVMSLALVDCRGA